MFISACVGSKPTNDKIAIAAGAVNRTTASMAGMALRLRKFLKELLRRDGPPLTEDQTEVGDVMEMWGMTKSQLNKVDMQITWRPGENLLLLIDPWGNDSDVEDEDDD